MGDYSEMCDYEYLKKRIREILKNGDISVEKTLEMIGELVGIDD